MLRTSFSHRKRIRSVHTGGSLHATEPFPRIQGNIRKYDGQCWALLFEWECCETLWPGNEVAFSYCIFWPIYCFYQPKSEMNSAADWKAKAAILLKKKLINRRSLMNSVVYLWFQSKSPAGWSLLGSMSSCNFLGVTSFSEKNKQQWMDLRMALSRGLPLEELSPSLLPHWLLRENMSKKCLFCKCLKWCKVNPAYRVLMGPCHVSKPGGLCVSSAWL